MLDSSNCQVSRARRAGSSAWLSREVTNLRHSLKNIYIEGNLPIVTSLIRFINYTYFYKKCICFK